MKLPIPSKNEVGKCPHCNTSTRFESVDALSDCFSHQLEAGNFNVYGVKCPVCNNLIVGLLLYSGRYNSTIETCRMLYPLGSARPPVPLEVPEQIGQDYKEACLVEPLSKKAAAALARRCLQNLLRDPNAGNVEHSNLSKEIDQVLSKLPSALAESVDAIRNVGNWAAHPNKYEKTGEIVNVEPQEAEWLLDTLEELFDHYCVKPKRIKERRAKVNQKLEDLGKPPLK